MNTINVIFPYEHRNQWVFDDEEKGLTKEPFVGGMEFIIGKLVKDIPNAQNGFACIFSATPFPGHQFILSWIDEDGGGNWYTTEGMLGWLCPALLKYFDKAPEKIYFKVTSEAK